MQVGYSHISRLMAFTNIRNIKLSAIIKAIKAAGFGSFFSFIYFSLHCNFSTFTVPYIVNCYPDAGGIIPPAPPICSFYLKKRLSTFFQLSFNVKTVEFVDFSVESTDRLRKGGSEEAQLSRKAGKKKTVPCFPLTVYRSVGRLSAS